MQFLSKKHKEMAAFPGCNPINAYSPSHEAPSLAHRSERYASDGESGRAWLH
jgi:hypothetical protein